MGDDAVFSPIGLEFSQSGDQVCGVRPHGTGVLRQGLAGLACGLGDAQRQDHARQNENAQDARQGGWRQKRQQHAGEQRARQCGGDRRHKAQIQRIQRVHILGDAGEQISPSYAPEPGGGQRCGGFKHPEAQARENPECGFMGDHALGIAPDRAAQGKAAYAA